MGCAGIGGGDGRVGKDRCGGGCELTTREPLFDEMPLLVLHSLLRRELGGVGGVRGNSRSKPDSMRKL